VSGFEAQEHAAVLDGSWMMGCVFALCGNDPYGSSFRTGTTIAEHWRIYTKLLCFSDCDGILVNLRLALQGRRIPEWVR
jgi:hypothetical protein